MNKLYKTKIDIPMPKVEPPLTGDRLLEEAEFVKVEYHKMDYMNIPEGDNLQKKIMIL